MLSDTDDEFVLSILFSKIKGIAVINIIIPKKIANSVITAKV
jgi:hypothetical protein